MLMVNKDYPATILPMQLLLISLFFDRHGGVLVMEEPVATWNLPNGNT